MSESILWALSILGVLVVPVLVVVIRRQLQAIAKPSSQTKAAASSKAESSSTTKLGVVDSLEVIATLTLDDQIELSEACIRIKILLDHYDVTLHEEPPFSIFSQVHAALEHMPTHAARKKTDKRFIHKLDQQRFAIEARHREAIRAGAKALLERLKQPPVAE